MKRLLTALLVCLAAGTVAFAAEPPASKAPKSKKVIAAQNAPAAIGPYSQAIKAGSLLFLSGSLGMDPASGKIVEGGVAPETEQALNNLEAVLKEAGAEFGHIVKTTIFLADMADFKTVNEIYAKRFSSAPPARSCVAVKELPRGGKVEIEAIAVVPRPGKERK